MIRSVVLAASAVAVIAAGSALAQDKKTLAIVVKGLDNAFFEAINQGCQKWNKENASSEYECFYTGPASTSDEAGEAQIVQRLFAVFGFVVLTELERLAGFLQDVVVGHQALPH